MICIQLFSNFTLGQIMIFLRFTIFIALLLSAKICLAQNGCKCVPRCFPNLPVDVGGQFDLDIRIVNGNPSPTASTSPCTGGLIQCCSECGVVYNITTAPNPGAGQGRYGSQPWQTVIVDNKNNYLGGGVLIDERHVLTAAHKVYQFNSTPTNVMVRLGEWDVSNITKELFNPKNSSIIKIFIHGQYIDAAKNLLNDIAILRLASPISFGPAVNPAINTACLPTAASFDNMICSVAGWGKNAFNGSYQAIIKEVEVPIVNHADCQTRLRNKTRLGPSFNLDEKSFICAGGKPGKDSCVGDGGSPLMCKVGNRYQVAGLVAWGIGCANEDVPGVYVRVQTYLDFINSSRIAP